MKALAFSEHGSVFKWWHKKQQIEAAGMKYVHAVEAYLTEELFEYPDIPDIWFDEHLGMNEEDYMKEYTELMESGKKKIRDNYHCVLLAKNFEGFKELNKLISSSFNRTDGHYYYVPRITFEELFKTSDNIIITTACVGGVLGKGTKSAEEKYIDFLVKNKHRCFLEIGHHRDEKQVLYNKKLYELSQKTGLPLIAGTDTHVLNATHEMGRSILQAAKDIHFEGEDAWDLKFKTLTELIEAYRTQNSLPKEVYVEAIENTNKLADMIEGFEIDKSTKYPKLYDNPEATFREKIVTALDNHPYALKNHPRDVLEKTIDEEFEVYSKTKSIDFMLLQTYLREWEAEHGIQCGYGRGSVSGSMIAYILNITKMDSLRFGLNFFRFMNPERVTNADIDSDYSNEDRDKVKEFLLRDKMDLPNINSAEIITFNTIALKGAVRDVCRALYKNREDINYIKLSAEINKLADEDEEKAQKKYPEVFKYVDIIKGTIVSIGSHPSGVLISDLQIDELVGFCSTSGSSYQVSMIDMKELDDLMYVKLDILGLDNIGVVNDTCKMLGIERLTPDNVDLNDEEVWREVRDDSTLIFQWEKPGARKYIKKLFSDNTIKIAKSKVPNFQMIKWLSFGSGLLRPACASFRNSVAEGEFYDNGFDALNEFLAPEAGRLAMQETIMQFLVKFCGYSAAKSDIVRRAISKKKGTEQLLPEIRESFIDYTSKNYGISKEKCEEVIEPFLKIILDASDYSFSWNHSDPYSCLGYISGYLRHYYPIEFLTAALNVFEENLEKTAEITKYANKHGISVTAPKWGLSRDKYYFDKEKNIIAKGLTSIKFLSKKLAREMYKLYENDTYERFIDLLIDLFEHTSIDSRQLEILIKLDFFSDFGNQRELFRISDLYINTFKRGDAKQIKKTLIEGTPLEEIVKKYAVGITKSGGVAKSYTLIDVISILREAEDAIKASNMSDVSDMIKVQNFVDVMGYVGYVSGKEEDRRKLYIMEIYPALRKKDKKQFGYNITTKSLGSGKESRFTIFNTLYNKNPVHKGEIIYCSSFTREGQYYTLTGYNKLTS